MFVYYAIEGLRLFKNSVKVRTIGHKKYAGDADQICRQIVEDCWNSKKGYFMTSTGNFSQFWSRDFCFCTEALVNLGYREKVIRTLRYALAKFSKNGHVTTSITPYGVPYNFPFYAADSLPCFVRSLKIAKADKLIEEYKQFILKEAKYYADNVMDKETGMIRADKHFSSMKDYSKRKSATYDNCMAAMLSIDLDEMGLKNPLEDFDIKKGIKKELWNGRFFYDDLNKFDNVYGDANVFPFWTDVFYEKDIFESCLDEIKKAKLDKPFPIKYSSQKVEGQKMTWHEFFVGNYEQDAIWFHMGPCFLDVLKKQGKKKDLQLYLDKYTALVNKHKNFLEVYDKDGKPFKTPFYYTDAGMLWASKILVLQ
jgi:hypothetical protein